MDRVAVNSSNLYSVGYSQTDTILEVQFRKHGSVYRYLGVPLVVYDGLMSAPSHGKYFQANIRWSYPYQDLGIL